jgi:hypothetical protein
MCCKIIWIYICNFVCFVLKHHFLFQIVLIIHVISCFRSPLRNWLIQLNIHLFWLVMEYHFEKKTENCIIARKRMMQSFRNFADDSSITLHSTLQKYIHSHLIISKHKYYVIKFMFHVLFLQYTPWSVRFSLTFEHLHYRFFKTVTQNHPNFSTYCSKVCCMKN